jgi:hypothetical protein
MKILCRSLSRQGRANGTFSMTWKFRHTTWKICLRSSLASACSLPSLRAQSSLCPSSFSHDHSPLFYPSSLFLLVTPIASRKLHLGLLVRVYCECCEHISPEASHGFSQKSGSQHQQLFDPRKHVPFVLRSTSAETGTKAFWRHRFLLPSVLMYESHRSTTDGPSAPSSLLDHKPHEERLFHPAQEAFSQHPPVLASRARHPFSLVRAQLPFCFTITDLCNFSAHAALGPPIRVISLSQCQIPLTYSPPYFTPSIPCFLFSLDSPNPISPSLLIPYSRSIVIMSGLLADTGSIISKSTRYLILLWLLDLEIK